MLMASHKINLNDCNFAKIKESNIDIIGLINYSLVIYKNYKL